MNPVVIVSRKGIWLTLGNRVIHWNCNYRQCQGLFLSRNDPGEFIKGWSFLLESCDSHGLLAFFFTERWPDGVKFAQKNILRKKKWVGSSFFKKKNLQDYRTEKVVKHVGNFIDFLVAHLLAHSLPSWFTEILKYPSRVWVWNAKYNLYDYVKDYIYEDSVNLRLAKHQWDWMC